MIHAEHIFIFTGPTLSPVVAAETLDAVYLPPAKMGDIYRVCKLFSPRIIGIIDGYFNQVPAVWHKEIHYALSQGIQVFGAASMGALRAAEMDQLGMTGCGEIYRAYQRGALAPFDDEPFENDDEVAVIHGPAELSYLAASDALVNIRFSLAAAMQHGIIDHGVGQQLAGIAKGLFYAQRRYAKVLEIASQQALPVAQITALKDWLHNNKIDQKQIDAITLLEKIEVTNDKPEPSCTDRPAFEVTSQWQTAIDEIDASHFMPDPVINELRLKGTAYFTALEQARSNASPVHSKSPPIEPKQLTKLHSAPQKLNAYLSEQWCQALPHVDSEPAIRTQTERQILNILEQSGMLTTLKLRAEAKQAMLDNMAQPPGLDSLGELDRLQLADWYFCTRLSSQIPDHPSRYAARLGFLDEDEFYAMLLTEYLYIESRFEPSANTRK